MSSDGAARGGKEGKKKKKKLMPASLANRACKYNCPLFILVLSFFLFLSLLSRLKSQAHDISEGGLLNMVT